MASVPPLFRAELARLAHLPSRAGHLLLGSLRPLDCLLFTPGETIQPWLAVWTDERSTALHGAQLINPRLSTSSGHGEALRALVHALGTAALAPVAPHHAGAPARSSAVSPRRAPRATRSTSGRTTPQAPSAPSTQPGLPERIYVDDEVLATMAADVVRPLSIPVEFRAYLPGLDGFFSSLTGFLATMETPSASYLLGPLRTG